MKFRFRRPALTRPQISKLITLVGNEIEACDEDLAVISNPAQVRMVQSYRDDMHALRAKLSNLYDRV